MSDNLLDLKQQKLSSRSIILIIIILFSLTVLVRLFLMFGKL